MIDMILALHLDTLFQLGGNHSKDKTIYVRDKLLDFLRREEVLLNTSGENFLIARDAVHFIDANNIYSQTTDVNQATVLLQPFFERLLTTGEKWNYYDLKLLSSAIALSQDLEQARNLASKSMERIPDFRINQCVDVLEGGLACNICSRLLYAKYIENDQDEEIINEFEMWFRKLEHLEDKQYKLTFPLDVTKIRWAILNQNAKEIAKLIGDIEYSEDYPDEAIAVVLSEARFYLNSEIYKSLKGGEGTCNTSVA